MRGAIIIKILLNNVQKGGDGALKATYFSSRGKCKGGPPSEQAPKKKSK
jgi:hypothetical protein